MIEFFLRSFARLAGVLQFLTPISIGLSIKYLQRKYQEVFLENNAEERGHKLHHLVLLRKKLHPPTGEFIVDVKIGGDVKLKVNICQQYCGDMYYGVGFEQDELDLVKRFVDFGDVFIDVGANIGVYTLVASRLVGENGQVHAFEPLSAAYGLLQENVKLNRAENVRLNRVAVGDTVGEVDLYVNAQAALTGLGKTNRGLLLDVQKVPIWTLDDYSRRFGIQSIDFLKIDVEGFEGHVLRGAEKLIANSPNLIIMSELANKNFVPLGFSVKDVVKWMRDIGFEVWMIRNDGMGLQYVQPGSDKYLFQNFVFIRRVNEKYDLLKSYQ